MIWFNKKINDLEISITWKRQCWNLFKQHKYGRYSYQKERLKHGISTIANRYCKRCHIRDSYSGFEWKD